MCDGKVAISRAGPWIISTSDPSQARNFHGGPSCTPRTPQSAHTPQTSRTARTPRSPKTARTPRTLITQLHAPSRTNTNRAALDAGRSARDTRRVASFGCVRAQIDPRVPDGPPTHSALISTVWCMHALRVHVQKEPEGHCSQVSFGRYLHVSTRVEYASGGVNVWPLCCPTTEKRGDVPPPLVFHSAAIGRTS